MTNERQIAWNRGYSDALEWEDDFPEEYFDDQDLTDAYWDGFNTGKQEME